ncbi:MAG: hypothetical protein ACYTF7_07760, partial [Planctomycetota bacterium]
MRSLRSHNLIPFTIASLSLTLPAHPQLNLRYYDGRELGLLLSQWGCTSCDDIAADIDGDCDVDIDDLAIFISLWGSIQPRLDYSRCPEPAWRPPTGEPVPDYDFGWATVTHPFNRTYEGFGDSPPRSFPGFGRVDYEYRIATTEVTAEQYLEFLNAYKPFAEDPTDSELLGPLVFDFTVVGTNELVYSILPGWEQAPTPMSWRMAARYCNWLHNNKAHEAWAFESGVYDTSTFTAYVDPDTGKIVINDQPTRSDGARFWIPNLDEWTKAAHYDPHKHGENQPGYWLFPTSSDEPPIPDLPENGGETSSGLREG